VAILLAGLSAVMYGTGDFFGGLAARKDPVPAVLALSQFVGLLIAVAGVFALAQGMPTLPDLLWGVAGGVCGTMGLAALYTAIATTPVAIASPVAAVTGAVIPALFGLAAGDRPDALAWVGIAVALPAIVLLTVSPSDKAQSGKARRAVLLGAVAGLGFGLFFVAIARTSATSGLWPLVAARVCTISLMAVFALVRGRSLRPSRAGLPWILACGCLDMLANIAFLLASRIGMLTIAAIVTSLYPGPTVLCAALVFRERLTLPRVLGLVLAVTGVALISV
jgi:drug/metabolite transporter (DMT)-like permease